MRYTDHFSLKKPQPAERALVQNLNDNADAIDTLIYQDRRMTAKAYDSQRVEPYVVGERCIYENRYYKCVTQTSGNWDSSAWDETNVGDDILEAMQSGGTEVIPNPTGTAVGILTSLGIDGDKYEIQGGSGGASALSDLDDVSLTTPTEGQILTYDGDEWVNADAPDVDVTKTASGNPIEVSDSASAPLVKCVSAITGSQDLHGYDKPWVGGAGKNKYGNGDQSFTQAKQNIVLLTPLSAGTYVFGALVESSDTDNTDCLIQLVDSNGAILASGRISRGVTNRTYLVLSWSGNDAVKLNLYAAASYVNGAGDTATYKDIQIEEGSTATAYEPYSNICPITAYTEGEIEVSDGDGNTTTHTATFPSAIYRGSADYVEGEVTEEWATVVLDGSDDEDWKYNSTNAVAYISLPNCLVAGSPIPQDVYTANNLFMDVKWGNKTDAGSVGLYYNSASAFIKYSQITSVADVRAFLATNPMQLAYKVATPTTSPISVSSPVKSLNGYSHIESSTGNMEIEYITSEYQPLVDLISDSGGGGSSTLAGLDDVSLTTPTQGQALVYDGNDWVNGNAIGGLVDGALDESNLLFESGEQTNFTQNAITYTATEDCYVYCTYYGSSGTNQYPYINTTPLIQLGAKSQNKMMIMLPMKSGDTISSRHTSDNESCYFKILVYGRKPASDVALINYSTTEQKIGTWIDGSTLFERTYVAALSNNVASIDISSLQISKGWVYDGFYDIGGTCLALNEVIDNLTRYTWTHLNYSPTLHNIDCKCVGFANATVYVTIRYTKSS